MSTITKDELTEIILATLAEANPSLAASVDLRDEAAAIATAILRLDPWGKSLITEEKMTLDPTKPVQTEDGRPARILCTDVDNPRSLVAAVRVKGGERALVYYPNGRLWESSKSDDDLINVPEKHVRWAEFEIGRG